VGEIGASTPLLVSKSTDAKLESVGMRERLGRRKKNTIYEVGHVIEFTITCKGEKRITLATA